MTESTVYTHNKVYSCLTSYLIAAGTTEVVLDLSQCAQLRCARAHGRMVTRRTDLMPPNMEVSTCLKKRSPVLPRIVRYCCAS